LRPKPDVPTLVDELINFQIKRPAPSTVPLVAWRERPQDDLIFAIAVTACQVERESSPSGFDKKFS
jgi:hypothetical protein